MQGKSHSPLKGLLGTEPVFETISYHQLLLLAPAQCEPSFPSYSSFSSHRKILIFKQYNELQCIGLLNSPGFSINNMFCLASAAPTRASLLPSKARGTHPTCLSAPPSRTSSTLRGVMGSVETLHCFHLPSDEPSQAYSIPFLPFVLQPFPSLGPSLSCKWTTLYPCILTPILLLPNSISPVRTSSTTIRHTALSSICRVRKRSQRVLDPTHPTPLQGHPPFLFHKSR